jgi:hypothetical protein
MRPNRRVLAVAVGAYAVAWILPSVRGQHVLRGLSGWDATRFALDPIWPWPVLRYAVSTATWLQDALSVASGLTNILFLAGTLIAMRWPQRATRGLAWAVILAALVNTHWFFWGPRCAPTYGRVITYGSRHSSYWEP